MESEEKKDETKARNKAIGQRVKLLQQSCGYSDEDMEALLHTSHSNYKKILRGDQLLTSDQAITLSDGLDAELNRILGGLDDLPIVRKKDLKESGINRYQYHLGELILDIEMLEPQDRSEHVVEVIKALSTIDIKK